MHRQIEERKSEKAIKEKKNKKKEKGFRIKKASRKWHVGNFKQKRIEPIVSMERPFSRWNPF